MPIEFPLRTKRTALGLLSDPRIPVSIATRLGDMEQSFLIDTGADFSLAPRRLAALVGLEWRALQVGGVRGLADDDVQVRLGLLPVRIDGVP